MDGFTNASRGYPIKRKYLCQIKSNKLSGFNKSIPLSTAIREFGTHLIHKMVVDRLSRTCQFYNMVG